MANEIETALNAYLAKIRPVTPAITSALSAAFLAGFEDGLERGNEIALSAMDTALEAMRGHSPEHYPEVWGNALRDYLSRPGDELLRESDGSEGGDLIEAEKNAQGAPSAWSDTHPAMTFHTFKGRLDRDCELCGKPDRDTIHVHTNRE